MKCLSLLMLMLLLLGACQSTEARVPYEYRPLGESNFQTMSTAPSASIAASADRATRPSPQVTPSPAVLSTRPSRPRRPTKVIYGEASWGYGFHGHVVTRYPRGTIIRVCGPLACTPKVRSWGYGPAKKTGRIADLDKGVFRKVCGGTWRGVCDIRLEVWK